MNFLKMYTGQATLMDKIESKHPANGEERTAMKFVGMLTEFSECINEHRGFKFWSDNRKANTFERVNCPKCEKKGYYRGNPPKDDKKGVHGLGNHWYFCDTCAGYLVVDKNPLLEEYNDGIHWLLEFGIDNEFYITENYTLLCEEETVEDQFIETIALAIEFYRKPEFATYSNLFAAYLGLGNLLGFSTDQIEKAYFEKNEINMNRQETGY